MKQTIFPTQQLHKSKKEALLNQKSMVFWLTGLSGSGKSSIAAKVEQHLHNSGYLTKWLDGDNIRSGLCNNVDFSNEGREENIRRVAEVSKLFVENGTIVICTFISPLEKMRLLAKEIIGEENFKLIYINTPLDICIKRDPKGLYKKAIHGLIKDFTGISAPYEIPESADLEVNGGQNIEVAVNKLLSFMLNNILTKN